MDPRSDIGNIRISQHNAKLQETRQTVEKQDFLHFRDSIAKIYWLVSTKMEPRSHMYNNTKFRKQRRAAENPINRRKTGIFGLPRQYCEDLLIDFDENGPKESHQQ